MFCVKCGKEIRDGSAFCSHCGAKQKPNKGKTLLIVLILILLLILVGLGILLIRMNNREETFKDSQTEEMTKEPGTVEETASAKQQEETDEAAEEEYRLLVCVPADYMSLRENPGLGEDVIAELNAGTYLKWYGESAMVDEREYYKVKVRDSGQEGYVAANYCVSVEFEYAESDLTIVETDTTLYTYDMMMEDIETLCDKYPDRLCDNVIGYSADGRKIHEIVFGNPNAPNHIMMQAGIHGREYMTSQLIMRMLEYYSFYYETGEYEHITYKDIFENTALHIVPMTNPDGVTISQLGVDALNDSYYKDLVYECYERDKGTLIYEEDSNGDLNWADYYRDSNFNRSTFDNRQMITFEEYQTIWKSNARGVDLNNNFDAGWEDIDLKAEPAYGSFKGYYPVSEPESQALVDLAYAYDHRCFISYHSRGQLIYYDVVGNTPENSEASYNFAQLLESRIKYGPVNTGNAYNVNLGGFGDWVQLSLNKPSVTIESGKKPCPLEIEEFPAIWNRHRESWAMLGMQFYQ